MEHIETEGPPTEDDLREDAEPTQPEATNGNAPDSFVEDLRRRREAIASGDRTLDLAIPGYDGKLVARYYVPEGIWEINKRIADKIDKSKNPRKELLGMVDTLIVSCRSIMIRRDSATLIALNEAYPDAGDPDEPIRFDERLAKFLGFEANTARQIVLRTFENDMAVTVQFNDVAKWQQESRIDDDQDF